MAVNQQIHACDKDVRWKNATEKRKTEWEDRIVGLRREGGRSCGENSPGKDVEEGTVKEIKEVCEYGVRCFLEKTGT